MTIFQNNEDWRDTSMWPVSSRQSGGAKKITKQADPLSKEEL